MNAAEFAVFLILFLFVTALGFWSSRWQRGDLTLLDEWGLAGRRFGAFISWFLIGGDLYTAYTFIAVPALVFGTGAFGFFAVPYTIIVYPLALVLMPRLWQVAKENGFITAADLVRARFDSQGLALAVAATGILATMPYIALQLVGMQAVFQVLGLTGSSAVGRDVPLIVAFAVLAAYTYVGGLRAPALVAFVKDLLIYVTILVAIAVIPAKLGGFAHVLRVAAHGKTALLLAPKLFSAYATLALGSALALFFYPHATTAVLSARSDDTVRKNAIFLPLYSLLLGFIALLGFEAAAAHVAVGKDTNLAVPLLFARMFPSWFTGLAFAAVVIGALVPASIMSIAAANLFTRNIYRPYFRPDLRPEQETFVAKLVSLVVKLGALVFVIAIPLTFSIYLQLLGGIWILQTLPAIVGGLLTRWFHRTALLVSWLFGMVTGTWMAASLGFKTSTFIVHIGRVAVAGYAGIWALILNVALASILTLAFHAAKASTGDRAVLQAGTR